jgi:hypothetical protein
VGKGARQRRPDEEALHGGVEQAGGDWVAVGDAGPNPGSLSGQVVTEACQSAIGAAETLADRGYALALRALQPRTPWPIAVMRSPVRDTNGGKPLAARPVLGARHKQFHAMF